MTNHERPRVEHRMECVYEVAATPEQVWEAIATADGISAWMVPTRLDPRIGGEVSFDVGGFQSVGVVTDYDTNHRFAYEEPWPIADRAEDVPAEMVDWLHRLGVSLSQAQDDLAAATPLATEFLVETVSGGSCVIRIVTSSYGSGADWELEFFSEMMSGVVPLFDNLASYLHGVAERGVST